MCKYRRVTLAVRCQIEAYLQVGCSGAEIASQLGFHRSTIYREVVRNSSKSRGYRASPAQMHCKRRYRNCRKAYKLTDNLRQLVKHKILDDWSPEQISGRLQYEGVSTVSHECIYQYARIHRSRFLIHFRRLNRLRGGGRYAQRKGKGSRFEPNIKERPNIANERRRIGDWERDVMFAGNKTPILVCIDRKTRYVKIAKADDLKGHTINELTLKLLKETSTKYYTMTNDRGTEFKIPLKNPRTYFCDAQTPQQRGTVENTIGLIRQYIKRKTDPKILTNRYIKKLEYKLNHRPRKVLDYRTPHEVFRGTNVALAS